jgi:hypothetical protein
VLAVRAEGEVLGAKRASGPDLGGFLAEGGWPQADLAVALEGVGLDVDAAREDEVSVEAADRCVVAIEMELGMLDALSAGREQLDERKVVTDLI